MATLRATGSNPLPHINKILSDGKSTCQDLFKDTLNMAIGYVVASKQLSEDSSWPFKYIDDQRY